MASAHAWRPSGAAPPWPAAGRRDASSSRSVYRTSTRERKTPQASFGFPREARITRGAELQRITREGKCIRTTYLDVRVASPLACTDQPRLPTRVGLIVPRYKHSAVARNRLKRQLRELSRLYLLPTKLPIDVVIRIHTAAYLAGFEPLRMDIVRAMKSLERWDRRELAQPPVKTQSPAE